MSKKWMRIRKVLEIIDNVGHCRIDVFYFDDFVEFIKTHDIWNKYTYYVKGKYLYIEKKEDEDDY